MSHGPYIRAEVVHEDGEEAVYHVRSITINEPVLIDSAGTGLAIAVRPSGDVVSTQMLHEWGPWEYEGAPTSLAEDGATILWVRRVCKCGAEQARKITLEDRVPIGSSVRLTQDVERYPHFIAPEGMTGVVVDGGDPGLVAVRMDIRVPGAEEWNNEVHWYLPNGDDPKYDLEVV